MNNPLWLKNQKPSLNLESLSYLCSLLLKRVCMKRVKSSSLNTIKVSETAELFQDQFRRNPLPLWIFFLMVLNLFVAPAVYAASGETLERKAAWAIGLLIFVAIALAVYLFTVILQPERF